MKHRWILTEESVASIDLCFLIQTATLDLHLCAQAQFVTVGPSRRNRDPVVLIPALIFEEQGGAAIHIGGEVQVAVSIVVRNADSSNCKPLEAVQAHVRAHVVEGPIAVLEQKEVTPGLIPLSEQRSGRQQHVQIAVVVEVEELAAMDLIRDWRAGRWP